MSVYQNEAELCQAFSDWVKEQNERPRASDQWTVYNETDGWDMIAVRDDGFQIGVEAKLTLNAKVMEQALDSAIMSSCGPDVRAVLVPTGKGAVPKRLLEICGLTLISAPYRDSRMWKPGPLPEKAHAWNNQYWLEWGPATRCRLPEYVPDVPAGVPAPAVLSQWKISALKICALLAKRPVTRADFKALKIDPGRWMYGFPWLVKSDVRGQWVAGPELPNFPDQHPDVYAKIVDDYDEWSKVLPKPPQEKQLGLLS